jgi:hypothetical protein
MVSMQTKVMTPGQRQKARLQRVRVPGQVKVVRVEPRDDTMRRLLKHPSAGGFRSEGSIEWPDDTFTHRRLKEGSVRLVVKPDVKSAEKPADPSSDAKPKHQQHRSESNSTA